MAKSDETNEPERGTWLKEITGDLAKEAGFALRDIRSELVDGAWFNRDSWPQDKEKFEFYSNDPFAKEGTEHAGSNGHDVEREELYGRADWDNVRDVLNEQARRDQPSYEHAKDAQWEAQKEKAEALYGRDRDDDERGRDIDR